MPTVNLKKIPIFLYGMVFLIVLLGIVQRVFVDTIGVETPLKDLRHISLDHETNLGAWFSSMVMLCIAGLAAIHSILERHSSKPQNWLYWMGLAVGFLYMSVDENIGIHEITISPLRTTFNLTGALYFAWVIPGAILVCTFGLVYLRFLWRLPRKFTVLFMISGSIYLGGALGFEMLSAGYAGSEGFESLGYKIFYIVEETFELIGLTTFLSALLAYLGEIHGYAVLTFQRSGQAGYMLTKN
ncbi:hypothetical protein PsAD2_00058 [Pseudovibrio axinellae]|uniref:Uncharacterized protein n=1 Tax=Pseudovibrio axinellae TaxID=989403 RepID=A0A166B955_9HYPH|nr:hypothetical protein [Pseudovibrio axinellae]KZL22033.1 hypothetical protein PsAD2_00058 [Pseudovibrio axinellae]SEQ57877.1 hypothetical protein SAMN05421798_103142 [Pseudovibrio axinellae]